MIFAQALRIGTTRYSTDEVSAILVTASKGLNIVIPESPNGPATYVDIPLENIRSVSSESEANSQSQSVYRVLTLYLIIEDGVSNCYVNASPNQHTSIALAFPLKDDAETLMKLVHSSYPGAAAALVSVSHGVAVSQPSPDDEPSLDRTSPGLEQLASEATANMSQLPVTSKDAPKLAPATATMVRDQKPDAARTISVAFGVDVSQEKPSMDDQNDTGVDGGPSLHSGPSGDLGSQTRGAHIDEYEIPSSAGAPVDSPYISRQPQPKAADTKKKRKAGEDLRSQIKGRNKKPKKSENTHTKKDSISEGKAGTDKQLSGEMQQEFLGQGSSQEASSAQAEKSSKSSEESSKLALAEVPRSRPRREAAKAADAKRRDAAQSQVSHNGQDDESSSKATSKGATKVKSKVNKSTDLGQAKEPAKRPASVSQYRASKGALTKKSKTKPEHQSHAPHSVLKSQIAPDLGAKASSGESCDVDQLSRSPSQPAAKSVTKMGLPVLKPTGSATSRNDTKLKKSSQSTLQRQAVDNKQQKTPEQMFIAEGSPKSQDELPHTEDVRSNDRSTEDLLLPLHYGLMGDIEDGHFQEAMAGMETRSRSDASQGSVATPMRIAKPLEVAKSHTQTRTLQENTKQEKSSGRNQVGDPFKSKLDQLAMTDPTTGHGCSKIDPSMCARVPKSKSSVQGKGDGAVNLLTEKNTQVEEEQKSAEPPVKGLDQLQDVRLSQEAF